MTLSWKALTPIAVAVILALIPAPDGLAQHAWYFFAIFAGVIVALILEPLPGGVQVPPEQIPYAVAGQRPTSCIVEQQSARRIFRRSDCFRHNPAQKMRGRG